MTCAMGEKDMNRFYSQAAKLFSCLLAAAFLLAALPATADNRHHAIRENLEHLLPSNTHWALVVIDMESGKDLATMGNALNEQLVPASLMKLITTGAALNHVQTGGSLCKTVSLVKKKPRSRRGKRRKSVVVRHEVEISDKNSICAMLRNMNVHSQNATAQNLANYLGVRRFGPPATRVKGNLAIRSFLDTLDLPEEEAVIADGCGLTRANRVTARYMARYLYLLGKAPWFEAFRETLPRPGLEGTVKRIGYTDRRFRVKTGRLNDVFALAGYGLDAAGRSFSFAFIVNGKGRVADSKHSRGELLRLLSGEYLEKTNVALY